MKTIEQWLNELESPYREQALSYLRPNMANKLRANPVTALTSAFDWYKTNEGRDYWYELRCELFRKFY